MHYLGSMQVSYICLTQSDDGRNLILENSKILVEIASKDECDNYIFSDIDAIPDTQLIKYFYGNINGFYSLDRWAVN